MKTHSHEAAAICEAADLEVARLRSDLEAAKAANARLEALLDAAGDASRPRDATLAGPQP